MCRKWWTKKLPEDSSGIFWLHQLSLIKNRFLNFAQTIKKTHIPNVSARAAGSSSTFHLSTHHLLHICDLHKCYGISNQAENTKKETITHDAWDGSMPPKPSIIPPMFSILPNSCDPSAEFLWNGFHQFFPQLTTRQQPCWENTGNLHHLHPGKVRKTIHELEALQRQGTRSIDNSRL